MRILDKSASIKRLDELGVLEHDYQRLSVITTNYDRLAEYAADFGGHGWSTGFGQGYVGHRCAGRRLTFYKDRSPLRMVDIWKVHGSLDWFRGPDGTVVSLPAVSTPLDGFSPVIVAPGVDKYRRTHEEPFRSTIAGADAAIDAGNSFLCVGYGFNDEHIQPKLLERCRRQDKAVVVLAKQLTDAAKRVLLDGRVRHFTAFEEIPGGTRMFTPEHRDGVDLDNVILWSLAGLLDSIL